MPYLFEQLKDAAIAWRKSGYQCRDYPLIGEILAWQSERLDVDPPDLKYLREPQFLALEVYWYVRLILRTPKIMDLYRHFYGDNKTQLINALGITMSPDVSELANIDDIVKKIKTDKTFVRENQINALHKAVNLKYPSYILAPAMGAGKTVLIGTIIATEFAMSRHHPDGNFMKNALVFTSSTAQNLRGIKDIPFDEVLPPHLYPDFIANLRTEFQSNSKTIQVQTGSGYNLIVTNTEKIGLRVSRQNLTPLDFERRKMEANWRLQTIAGLQSLGIFSDEGHHGFADTSDKLKQAEKTINLINRHTKLVVAINATDAPYYKNKILAGMIV